MSVEAASPDAGGRDGMRRVSYQAVLGGRAGRPRRGVYVRLGDGHHRHPPQGRAQATSRSRSPRPRRRWLREAVALSGPGIDEGAVLRALVDLGMELEIDWAVIARGKALRAGRARVGDGAPPGPRVAARGGEGLGGSGARRARPLPRCRRPGDPHPLAGDDELPRGHAPRRGHRGAARHARLVAAPARGDGRLRGRVPAASRSARYLRQVKEITDVLGDARDLDVAIERLTATARPRCATTSAPASRG